MPRLRLEGVALNLPFGIGGVSWSPDRAERDAAWHLYVELVTRVATQPLSVNEGSLREALTSLHQLFAVTRQILRDGGPEVGSGPASVGGIAIAVLNQGIRPLLAEWHPRLEDWERQQPTKTSRRAHERSWDHEMALRADLNGLTEDLAKYVEALALIAGVAGASAFEAGSEDLSQ